MDSRKKVMLKLGFVFLACGATFLIVGLSTGLPPFTAMGPALIAIGVVFMAVSKSRAKNNPGPGDS